MDSLQFVEMAITQTRTATLATVKELNKEQLTYRVGPKANPVGFLIWHVFRTEDRYVRTLTGQEESYQTEGWSNKWSLPATITGDRMTMTTGNSWTAEEVGIFQV